MTPIVGRSPDNGAWASESGYSRQIARPLTRIHKSLSNPSHRLTAVELEEARKSLPDDCDTHVRMSAHQRFSLASLHCQLTLNVVASDPAMIEMARGALLRAYTIARRLDDRGALAECAYLAGWVRQAAGNYAKAAGCFQKAVTTLRELRQRGLSCDTAFELLALSELAVHRFLLAQYKEAECCIEWGKLLSLGMPQAERQQPLATLFWVKSFLQRWRGNLEDALRCAFDSADLLAADAHDPSSGRIHAIAGEIALDIAERYSAERPAHGRTMWLSIAQSRIEEAMAIAAKAGDSCGEGIAILGSVRHDRMSVEARERKEKSEERLARIARAEKIAAKDPTLLCQVETARGHEADASGDHRAALKHYRRAMSYVSVKPSDSDAPSTDAPTAQPVLRGLAQAFGIWPQRELLRSQERMSDELLEGA